MPSYRSEVLRLCAARGYTPQRAREKLEKALKLAAEGTPPEWIESWLDAEDDQ